MEPKTGCISYNAAIGACEKGALGLMTLEISEEMNLRCLTPDTNTVHSVLRACSITVERAVALFG